MHKIISRAEAREQGLLRFFTGRPCKRGHVAPRAVSNFRCIPCGRIKARLYEKIHPEKKRRSNTLVYQRLRQHVLDQFEAKCVCCGEQQPIFLCFDHIDGGGRKHRLSLGSGADFLRWLRDEINKVGIKTVRKKFRVLCCNCNYAMHALGFCPHHPRIKHAKQNKLLSA
jgi:hypothetical protein